MMRLIKGSFPFLKEKGHVVSLVGAGGKTSLMYALAEQAAEAGERVLVTTTTHIYRPSEALWAKSAEEIQRLWGQGSYAVAGCEAENGKLKGLPDAQLRAWIKMADLALIEADGARRMPCKVPAKGEPVIVDACDIVIGVMGMAALKRPLSEVCFRFEEAARLLEIGPDERLDVQRMAQILASEAGTRKHVGERDYYVVLNQCDNEERICAGEQILSLLAKRGIRQGILASFEKESEDR